MGIEATASQQKAFAATERISSGLSIFMITYIMATFSLIPDFRKPINRLIFFASFSNLGMNIAAMIAQDGLKQGQHSALCQAQAWAIQMFLGVDVFWALCMAINVFLALFYNWDAERMQKLEIFYIFGCYGSSLFPSLLYLLVHTTERGMVYGPALLWRWIVAEWEYLSIATLYGSVWLAFLIAFIVYTMAGIKVWTNRHKLSGFFNPFNQDPFIMTTETVTVSSNHREDVFEMQGRFALGTSSEDQERALARGDFSRNFTTVESQGRVPDRSAAELFRLGEMTRKHSINQENRDAWLYARTAFIFFCALVISWIPSSANRLYSLVYPDSYLFWLNYIETLVLPLQGFLNGLVYIISSQTACAKLVRTMMGLEQRPEHQNIIPLDQLRPSRFTGDSRRQRREDRRSMARLPSETNSTRSLRDVV